MSKKSSFYHIFVILQISALIFTFVPKSFARDSNFKTPQTVFSNTQSININTSPASVALPTVATTYPSPIEVSGMNGTVTNLSVTLKGLTHTQLVDIDMLLVGPTGVKYILLSDGFGNGTIQIEDKVITLTNGINVAQDADTFPAPAPIAPYLTPPATTLASAFNGTNPNGTWSLYVVDDRLDSAGNINSGWALNITTDSTPTTFANSSYIGLNDIIAASTPYGTAINVSGLSGVISNLTVTLNGFSHARPDDVDILLVSPNGKNLALMSDVGGANSVNSLNLTFDDAAANSPPTPLVSGTFKPLNISSEFFDTFLNPAPLRPYGNSGLSDFENFSPNGEWRLYVVDDSQNNSGSISGGWSLDITTAPAQPPTPASCSSPTFSPSNFATGTNPTNVAVADFNNDGKQDLAVTNQVSNDVSVLLGNGNGTFGTQTLLSAGSSPYAIVAGKFNADNNFDLAVANSGSNNVSILLGNGNGGFSAPTNFVTGSSPISLAVGDFNNNGAQDLVVANFGGFFSGSVSVLLGNGNGVFTAGNSIRTRTQPSFVTVGNISGDANQDIVVSNFGADSVSTFFGLGNGTFQLNQNISTGAGPVAVELFDLGTDGILDLAVANYNSDTVTFCNGNANGSFTICNSNNNNGGANPISLTSADFIGSGTKNLASALSGSNLVRLLNTSVAVGQNPNAVKSADFNGDNKPDLVSVNSGSNDVSVLINSCLAAKGNIFDFDGDRKTNFSVFRPGNTNWLILNSFQSSFTQKDFARATDTLVPADYNGDRVTDYAFYRPESGLWTVIDNINRPIYFLPFGLPTDIPVPADYDGDGKSDIAVWRPSDGNWYVRRSSDNGLLIVNFGMNGDKPVAGDYDGDGKDDFAIFRPSTGLWAIFKSSDSQYILTTFGMNGDKAVPADYDGDNKYDIAVFRPAAGAWYVLQSSDNGFRAATWGNSTDIPVTGDYDGDGKYDFAVYRPSDGTWYVLKSSDSGGLFVPWGTSTDFPIPSAFIR